MLVIFTYNQLIFSAPQDLQSYGIQTPEFFHSASTIFRRIANPAKRDLEEDTK